MEPEQLASIRLFVDTAMLMLIWLVQLVIYPAFEYVSAERFKEWHDRYMRTISFFVVPLMLLQGLLVYFQCTAAWGLMPCISAAALLLAFGTTFTLSVPCHRKLHEMGNLPALTRILVRTNWIRTAAWSVVWLSAL
jgi:hypothetical protein